MIGVTIFGLSFLSMVASFQFNRERRILASFLAWQLTAILLGVLVGWAVWA